MAIPWPELWGLSETCSNGVCSSMSRTAFWCRLLFICSHWPRPMTSEYKMTTRSHFELPVAAFPLIKIISFSNGFTKYYAHLFQIESTWRVVLVLRSVPFSMYSITKADKKYDNYGKNTLNYSGEGVSIWWPGTGFLYINIRVYLFWTLSGRVMSFLWMNWMNIEGPLSKPGVTYV